MASHDRRRGPGPQPAEPRDGRLERGQHEDDEPQREVVELAVDPEPAGDLGAVAVREENERDEAALSRTP